MLERIVLSNFTDSDLTADLWHQLRSCASSIVLASHDSSEYFDALTDADALILRLGQGVDDSLLERAPKLRYVGMYGTGYGRIDVPACVARGVTVTNVRDYSTESVAELCVAAAINHLRRLPEELLAASANGFSEPKTPGRTLASQQVGVIGMGAIGSRFAEIVSAGIGSKVLYYSRTRKTDIENDSLRWADIDELVSTCDVISLHVPAGPGTTPILSAELIDHVKPGALIINSAPNEVLDIGAIERRLASGSIAFVLDHTDEMPAEDAERLSAYPGCYAYPPLGYVTVEADAAKRAILVSNVQNFIDGSPSNVVS